MNRNYMNYFNTILYIYINIVLHSMNALEQIENCEKLLYINNVKLICHQFEMYSQCYYIYITHNVHKYYNYNLYM